MSRPIIEVENLSKRYRLGQFNARTLREEVERFLYRFRKNGQPTADNSEFWALKDVSFSVQPGAVVGIIGRNGAGKSTLLKILSRVTEPTSGSVRIRGRVASLLEVGTGFHPELTGRENIYLNGTILGMTRSEVKRRFDEIVDFSGVEKFLDTPVKRYSSGMYVRLAFAVAAHLEPEILIVDEVLAVGDAAFQKKCLGKMADVSTREGRTVLFVSHNLQAVNTLCSRAVLLELGKVAQDGDTRTVVDRYLKTTFGSATTSREQVWTAALKAPGNDAIRVHRIALVPEATDPSLPLDTSTPFRIEVDYWNLVPKTSIIVNLCFYALDGSPVFESLSTRESSWHGRPFPKGLFRSVCHIPGHLLNEGGYRLRLLFVSDRIVKLYDYPEAATIFIADAQVRDIGNIAYYDRFIGHIHPRLTWRTLLLEESKGA